jgi:hypothetical protein
LPSLDNYPSLTPLQRVIYETDLLGLTLRDSQRLATQRMGFFVGQHKYLQERVKIQAFIQQYGPPTIDERDYDVGSRDTAPQVGSP